MEFGLWIDIALCHCVTPLQKIYILFYILFIFEWLLEILIGILKQKRGEYSGKLYRREMYYLSRYTFTCTHETFNFIFGKMNYEFLWF